MNLFIVHKKDLIPVHKEIVESSLNFTRRIEFLLYALDQNIPFERAQILSYCYLNRIVYDSHYSSVLEQQISEIETIMNKSEL